MSDRSDKFHEETPERLALLRPKFGDPKIITTTIGDNHCDHHYVALKPNRRIVTCRVCHQKLDAFEVLKNLSLEWRNCTYLQEEQTELRASVAQLKEDEKRLKARLRKSAASSDERAEEFVALALKRLNGATTQEDMWQFRNWTASFKWLSPEQVGELKRAETEAKRRVELHRVATKKSRNVVVLAGGKAEKGTK